MSVKVKLHHRKRIDGTQTIVIQLIKDRDVFTYSTGHAVKPSQFKDGIVIKHPDARIINADIEHQRQQHFEKSLTGTVENKSLLSIIRAKLIYHEKLGQVGAYNKLHTIEKAVKEILGDPKKITKELIEKYITSRKIAKSTLRKDLSVLFQLTGDPLFKDARSKVKADPVNITKLSTDEFKKLESLELTGPDELVRDMFLFSYYCHGMRLENVITFKKSAIKDGKFTYQMNKGKVWREIEVHKKLRKLIDKYNGSPYMFPMLKAEIKDVWDKNQKISSQNAIINGRLKVIAAIAGIKTRLHFHVARHTFAFHSLERDVNTRVIKDALGHGSISTTENYLRRLSDKKVNDAVNDLYK